MKFRVRAGLHVQDGHKFKKGEVVESDHNLIQMFPQKFDRVSVEDEQPAEAPAEQTDEGQEEQPATSTRRGRRKPANTEE